MPWRPAQVFVKSSWHVSDAFTTRYSAWAALHAQGDAGTAGAYDEAMYKYAIR